MTTLHSYTLNGSSGGLSSGCDYVSPFLPIAEYSIKCPTSFDLKSNESLHHILRYFLILLFLSSCKTPCQSKVVGIELDDP